MSTFRSGGVKKLAKDLASDNHLFASDFGGGFVPPKKTAREEDQIILFYSVSSQLVIRETKHSLPYNRWAS
jgi:hypothetical protein